MVHMSEQRKRELMAVEGIALDGMPASIVGIKDDFPSVMNAHYSVEYSWQAIERIITTKSGIFKS